MQLPFALLLDAFLAPGVKLFYPLLMNDSMDLFFGVDLMDWLSFDTSFAPLQSFAFVDGVSSALPGFFAATSPIGVSESGFFSESPYSGSAFVGAVGDAEFYYLPEAGTAWLLGLATLLLFAPVRHPGSRG